MSFNKSNRAVVIWLSVVCAMIVAMIVVGGITRLTESGLSMVNWRPVMGIIPPLNHHDWEQAFNAYKQYPQYHKEFQHMDLAGFKHIFYWEYSHRLLGRTIGLVFFVPFVILWWRKKFDRAYLPRMFGALILGGLQGLLGWYMVKSGLVNMPRVSHFRLAAHLMLALFILSYLFWLILDILNTRRAGAPPALRRAVYVITAMLVVQIMYGAFVAGMRAGYGYNTFPKMYDKWIADAVFAMKPWWINLVDSGATVQFIHRWLGTAILVFAFTLWMWARGRGGKLKWATAAVACAVLIQFTLGVLTLVNVVPIDLASMHQAWACVVLLSVVHLLYVVLPVRRTAST